MTPAEAYRQVLAEVLAAEANAIRTGKPTMWAYYADMADMLADYIEAACINGHIESLKAASHQIIREGMLWPAERTDVARFWALGVYARRILRLSGVRVKSPSLDWLRAQQQEGAA